MSKFLEEIKKEQISEEERLVRPSVLAEFVGQEALKENLQIFISSAKMRNQTLDHSLFYGPPGLGKTTLANIIAKEMDSNIKISAGPILSKTADLVAILTNINKGDVLFIDEIHRLPIAVEEILYSAMEDYRVDILIGQGPAARTVKIDIQPFTLIGATTRLGLLSNPLRDRFGIVLHLEFYSFNELKQIITNSARKLSMSIEEDAAFEIAKRSRGTPRIAIRLIKRVADISFFLTKIKHIDKNNAILALEKLGVNSKGLDSVDMKYLNFINNIYKGGPVGIETISVAMSEDKNTIEEAVEPFLIQSGLVQKTNRGRVLTTDCIEFLKSSVI